MSLTDQMPDETPTRQRAAPGGPRHGSRDTWSALKRGLRGRCPACGDGAILYSYLKVNETCEACGEELHHHRADDFPPYVTIFVVAHILLGAMFAIDDVWPDLPVAFHFAVWPFLCVVMCLWLLPIFKGGLIAYQWALRMHGFETAHHRVSFPDPVALAAPVLSPGSVAAPATLSPGRPVPQRSAA